MRLVFVLFYSSEQKERETKKHKTHANTHESLKTFPMMYDPQMMMNPPKVAYARAIVRADKNILTRELLAGSSMSPMQIAARI